MTSRVTKDLD